MLQPTIQDLTNQVRLESGLRSNQVLSDADIQSFLAEAYADLRDRLIVRFAYWFKHETTFTLQSSSPGNVFDLTTVPDFQMAQGLDFLVSDQVAYTVPMLASFQERNAFNGTWPFLGSTWGYNGVLGRKYWVDGNDLVVFPAQNAAGTYKLIYTPIQQLSPTVTVPITIGASDTASDVGGHVQYEFFSVTSLPDWVGGTVTVNFSAPNTLYNGTSNILSVNGSQIVTDKIWPGPGFSNPASGTASVVYQPIGTISTIPAQLLPWTQYLVLYAAIAVRNSRNQDTSALLARFGDIKQRVIDLTKQRSEGVRQAPISRNRYGLGSGAGGPGFGF